MSTGDCHETPLPLIKFFTAGNRCVSILLQQFDQYATTLVKINSRPHDVHLRFDFAHAISRLLIQLLVTAEIADAGLSLCHADVGQ